MGRNRTFKRLSAMALAAVMALSLAAPALAYPGFYTPPAQYRGMLPGYVPMAVNYDPNYGIGGLSSTVVNGVMTYAPPYQITINPGTYTETPPNANDPMASRFHAYQIFAGDLVDDTAYPGNSTGGSTGVVTEENRWEGAPGMLNGIRWGMSVTNINAVLNALTDKETPGNAALTLASSVNITMNDLWNAGERYWKAYASDIYDKADNSRLPETPDADDLEDGVFKDNSYWSWDSYANEWIFDKTQFEADLKVRLTNNFKDLTLADLFTAALNYANYKSDGTGWADGSGYLTGTAKVVAQVLSDFTPTKGNNNDLAKAFARILYYGECLGNEEDHSIWNGSAWTIGGSTAENKLAGGYYLIVDEYKYQNGTTPKEDTTLSDFMVGVYGDITMYAKSEPPTVDKKIKNNNFDPLDPDSASDERVSQSFEIGEEITFEITGTLPDNYDSYIGYKYEFIDTMNKGLTYVDGSIQVYVTVRVPNPVYQEEPIGSDDREDWEKEQYLEFKVNITELSPLNGDAEGKRFSVTKTEAAGETTLTISFKDLKKLDFSQLDLTGAVKENIKKQLMAKGAVLNGYTGDQPTIDQILEGIDGADMSLWSDSVFTITYKAHLNENADPNDPNLNKVKLRYTVDPKGPDTTTETQEAVVYPYTFGLDLLKYDGSKQPGDASAALENAGFSLSKVVPGGTKEYALYDESGELVMWISEAELAYYLGDAIDTIEDWSNIMKDPLDVEEVGYSAVGRTLEDIAKNLILKGKLTANVIPSAFSEFVLIPSGLVPETPEPDPGSSSDPVTPPVKPNTRVTTEPTTYHAIVKGTVGQYTLAGWISDEDLLELYQGIIAAAVAPGAEEGDPNYDRNEVVKVWASADGQEPKFDEEAWEYFSPKNTSGVLTGATVKNHLYPGYTANDTYYIVMLTAVSGRLQIVGLDNSIDYFLTERFAPSGYDKLETPIQVKFSAEFYDADTDVNTPDNASGTNKKRGELKELSADVTYTGNDNALGYGTTDPKRTTMVQNGKNVNPAGPDLQLHMNVANYPNNYLPGTGGMGTYLFYAAGSALLAGAVLLLVLSNGKRKPGKREQR